MAAGEAHWQNGIVERHIGAFREHFSKLQLEDTVEGATPQDLCDSVCEQRTIMELTMAPHQVNGWWASLDFHC